MPVLFTNNASAPLASSISSSATAIVVTTGQGTLFPALSGSDYFYATLTNSSNQLEIVKVTARSSDTMTVVRGQEGTTARAYVATDKIEVRVTAAGLTNMVQLDGAQTITGVKNFTTAPTFSGGALSVASGGTGNASQTQYGVLYAATTSSLTGNPSVLSFDGTNLGIGTNSPSTYGKLTVLGTGSFTNSLVSTSSTAADKPTLEFRKTRNTGASETNAVGRLSFYSQQGSSGTTTTETAYLSVSDTRISNISYPQISLVAYSAAVGTNLASLAVGQSTRLFSQLNITYEGNQHTFTGPVIFNDSVTATTFTGNATTATTATALSTASGSAPSYSARAWVCFDGTGTVSTNQTILAGGNIATVYKNGSGDYTLTFTTAMQDANYAIQITNSAATGGGISCYGSPYTNPTASAFRITVANGAGAPVDSPGVYVTVFR